MNPGRTMPARQADRALAASVAGGALAALTLYLFPPGSHGFYPLCPVHQYTGLLCPGCGATRALAALTHGRMAEAIDANVLFVALLPLALFYLGMAYLQFRRGAGMPRIPRTPAVLVGCAAAAFTLIRNLP